MLAFILPCLFINFRILPLLLVYLVFFKDTWNCYTLKDLLLHGIEYISSQIVQTANSEPKLSLIVLLFPCFLIIFQKKIHPACLFHPALLLILESKGSFTNYVDKILTIFDYLPTSMWTDFTLNKEGRKGRWYNLRWQESSIQPTWINIASADALCYYLFVFTSQYASILRDVKLYK